MKLNFDTRDVTSNYKLRPHVNQVIIQVFMHDVEIISGFLLQPEWSEAEQIRWILARHALELYIELVHDL